MDQWLQVNIAFPDWGRAEATVLAGLAPQLSAAEADSMMDAWFFIRKRPWWRVRYLPAAGTGPQTQARVELHLDEMAARRLAGAWTRAVYEPEVHAFGGDRAMTVAHRLFHHDSRCLLAYLRDDRGEAAHRREISLMLCSILMRTAGQDWYEQGDIWARIAAHREAPASHDPNDPGPLLAAIRRLITVDAENQMRDDAPLAHAAEWAAAYATAGQELASLAAAGHLHRGLRDILAHHVIFAWNRLGLPYATQAILAATAKTVVFGPDPTTRQAQQGERWAAQKTG